MNFSIIVFILGNILKVEGILLVFPMIISLIYREEPKNIFSFLIVILTLLFLGTLCTAKKPKKWECRQRMAL